MKKEDREKSQLYGKLIVDLANALTTEEAVSRLLDNMEKAFDISSSVIQSEKERIFTSIGGDTFIGFYEIHIQILKKFLSEFFQNDKNIYKTEHFSNFLTVYNSLAPPQVSVNEDGSLIEESFFTAFELGKFSDVYYLYITAYSLVRFMLYTRNSALIHICKKCNRYFISKRLRTKPSTFCSDKCRLDWHNAKRTASGEAAAAKAKGRSQGKYQ